MSIRQWWDDTIGQNGLWGDFRDVVAPGKPAADELVDAGEAGLEETTRRYEEGKGFIAPYQQQGLQDYQTLGGMVRGGEFGVETPEFQYGEYDEPQFDFQADPGYQFRRDEGLKSIGAQGAARGSALSSGTLKALQRYGSGLASQEYAQSYGRFERQRNYLRGKYERDRSFQYGTEADQYGREVGEQGRRYGRLAGLADVGIGAARNLSNLAVGQGTDISSILGQIGNAKASGIMANAQQFSNIVGSGADLGGDLATIFATGGATGGAA